MKKLKHLFTMLLLLCTTAVSAHDFEVNGIYYNIIDATNRTVAVTYCGTSYDDFSNEYTGSVVIPESVTYNGTTYSVTSIGSDAFYGCSGLTSVEIGNSVTSIGGGAFNDCTGLTSITIPNCVTSIVVYAFSGCSGLKAVHISDLAAWCGIDFGNADANPLYYAKNLYLNGEKLTELTIPAEVVEVKDYAFYDCTGLTSVVIPNSVTSIGEWAFSYCTGLTSIEIPGSVTSIGRAAFSGCSGLTSVVIPSSITSIGDYAFNGCSGLTSITIPNSVTSIGYQAFSGCAGLTGIEIPNSVTSIGDWAFNCCTGLTSVVIPNSVTSIGNFAFNNCYGLTSIVIPNSVTSIGDYAFSGCIGLTSIEIPNSVTSIGYRAFDGCTGLTSIVIPNSVTNIGNLAFWHCSRLTSIVIPNSVTNIGNQAFEGCSGLTSVEIGNSVTSIGDYAFSGCTGLKTIYNLSNLTFSKGSTGNGYVAYYADKVYNAPNGSIEGDFIFGKPNDVNTLLYYLGNARELTLPADYKGENYVIGADVFKDNTTITGVEIGNSVTSIGDYAFRGCIGLTSVVIPNSVTSIGDYAFRGCTGLKTIYNLSNLTFIKGTSDYGYVAYYANNVYNLPEGFIENNLVLGKVDGVNTLIAYLGNATELTLPADYKGENYVIGASVFKGNTTITSIEIPNSVTSIGNSAFSGCTGLTSVEIPNSVTSIGDNAFYRCSGLTSVVIPNSVTSIGSDAFYGCSGLNAVHISDLAAWCGIDFGSANANPLYYAKNLYLNGEKLTELVIPDGVVEIKNYTFYNCTGLTSVVIPNSVTSIGNYAFYNCTGLKTIYNLSNLTFSKGSTGNGYVAYYADNVYNLSEGFIENDFVLGKVNGVNTLVGYLGNATELTLPDDYKGENYAIGASVFKGNTTITSIVIPNSVTSIGDSAFYNCTGLTSVVIPNSVTSIGEYAFSGCTGLTGFEIPNSVTSIGNSAFYNCTGLTSVVIPNSVTSIGNSAFSYCTGLKTVINFSNLTFSKGSSGNGYVAYYADKVYNAPNGSIEGDFILGKPNDVNTLVGYLGNATEITLPADYKGENYVIGAAVFKGNTTITSIEIPNSVTSIGNQAFYNCSELNEVHISDLSAWCNIAFASADANPLYYAHNLYLNGELVTDLVIPDNVTNIRDYAFYDCTGLTSIEIPNSVTSIGNQAFYNCSELNEVHISDLSAWCNIAFASSDANPLYYAHNLYLNGELVTDLVIPDNVTNIRDYAFYDCTGLTRIEIPNSVTSIGNQAFENCTGLKTVYNFSNLTFSKGENTNGYVAYYADKVYNAPNGSIEGDFIWCNLNGANTLACYLGEVAELTLPADYNGENYVIGNDAFNSCTSLTSIVIPSSVTSIGEDAFTGCTGLKTVYNFSNLTFGKGENTNGYVAYYADKVYNAPNGSIEGDFIFGKPNDVNTLLYYLGNTANLILPTDYKGENYVIGSAVFKDNTVITSVTIPNSVTSVGDDAFTGCTNVEKLSLDCAEVGDWFCGVSAMKEVTIGNGVTSVVASAFNGCTGLEKVCINDLDAWCGIDFGSADANPLYYAKNLYLNGELLTELSIPAEIAEVKDYAFYNCNGVTNIDIVDGVKRIGNSAFYGCSNLETLYISNTIESIDDYAFAECNNIFDIKIGSKKAITASENVFSSDAYNNACLYVPTDRKDFYAKTSPWSNFIIREMDFTGIEELKSENGKVKTIYDLSGRAVENPTSGIYIIGGKKVLIK